MDGLQIEIEIRIRVGLDLRRERKGKGRASFISWMGSKWGHYLRTKNTMEKQFRWQQNITERVVGIEQMGGGEMDREEDLQPSDPFQHDKHAILNSEQGLKKLLRGSCSKRLQSTRTIVRLDDLG